MAEDTLQVNSIRKEFGTTVAVRDVNFTVKQGQVVGLIGPNGAGKTTLLRILATLLRPTSGGANILGCDSSKDYLKIRKFVGFLPDFFNLYNDLTLRECLDFFARAYGTNHQLIKQRIDSVLSYVELEEKQNDFISHLSRGMVQRMGVAVLLVHEPEILLLDEPASGLDPKARIQLRTVLKKLSTEGKTIVISSHILTELSGFCSHIAIMDEGGLVTYGPVDEIERNIFGARKIKIAVLDNCERAVELIKNFPQTKILETEKNTITVEINGDEVQLAELVKKLIHNEIKVYNFSELKSDLEDIFMKISSPQAQSFNGAQ